MTNTLATAIKKMKPTPTTHTINHIHRTPKHPHKQRAVVSISNDKKHKKIKKGRTVGLIVLSAIILIIIIIAIVVTFKNQPRMRYY